MFDTFQFESGIYRDLGLIPLCVRMKLDLAGVKLSRKTWLAFTMEEREILCRLPAESAAERKAYADYLDGLSERHTGEKPAAVPPVTNPPWENRASIPEAVAARSRAAGGPVTRVEWSGWNRFQRYALVKLAASKSEPEQFARALEEFRGRIVEAMGSDGTRVSGKRK